MMGDISTQEIMMEFWKYRPLFLKTIRQVFGSNPLIEPEDIFQNIVVHHSPLLSKRFDPRKGKVSSYLIHECYHFVSIEYRRAFCLKSSVYGGNETSVSSFGVTEGEEPDLDTFRAKSEPPSVPQWDMDKLAHLIQRLSLYHKKIVMHRISGLTFLEIGRIWGISRQHTEQIYDQIRRKIAIGYGRDIPTIPINAWKYFQKELENMEITPEDAMIIKKEHETEDGNLCSHRLPQKKCLVCGQWFQPKYKNSRFCSKKCTNHHNVLLRKEREKNIPVSSASPQPPVPSSLTTQVGGTHYLDMTIQPLDFILANHLNFCQGNIIKYVCRYAAKNGVKDLQKAKQYLEILIQQEEKGE